MAIFPLREEYFDMPLAAKDPVAASKHLQLALKDPNLPSADSARQALNKISKGTR